MALLPSSWLAPAGGSAALFPFIKLEGNLAPMVARPERVVYPGVDGIGLWFNGKRGEPFNVTTVCDYATHGAATLAFSGYHGTIGTKKQLFFQGAAWGAVAVLDVQLQGIRVVGSCVGGVYVTGGNSAALLSASWILESIP